MSASWNHTYINNNNQFQRRPESSRAMITRKFKNFFLFTNNLSLIPITHKTMILSLDNYFSLMTKFNGC